MNRILNNYPSLAPVLPALPLSSPHLLPSILRSVPSPCPPPPPILQIPLFFPLPAVRPSPTLPSLLPLFLLQTLTLPCPPLSPPPTSYLRLSLNPLPLLIPSPSPLNPQPPHNPRSLECPPLPYPSLLTAPSPTYVPSSQPPPLTSPRPCLNRRLFNPVSHIQVHLLATPVLTGV